MARMFSQSRDYTPLDDREEFDNDLPLNYIINDNADDEFGDDENDGRFSFSRIVILVKRLKIPRINFAYFGVRFRSIPAKSRRTCLDLVVCLLCMLSVLAVCVGLGYHALFVLKPAPVIDKSYRAFRIPNHEASLNYGALQTAKKNHTPFSRLDLKNFDMLYHHGRSGRGIVGEKDDSKLSANIRFRRDLASISKQLKRRRQARKRRSERWSQYYPAWKMQVIFMTEKGENIFTKERLHQIHDIEKKILAHENFSEFCFKDVQDNVINDPAVKAINGCAPLNSLLSYFFPSKDKTGNVFYDGLGENIDDIDSALRLAMTTNHFYYYVDDKVNSSNRKSQLLRTEVLFGAPLKGYVTPYTKRSEQSKKFKEFVITYIDILSKSSTKDVSVLYGGQEIFDYEVEQTFWNDVKLAIYAFVAIFLLMLILTSGSLWLTFWGLISILMSAPLAIFFYRVVFKIVGLGILNGAAAFVIIGIGVDDVFVFINIFRQADHVTDPRERTLYTIKTAGKATFFTSFTTAAAFAANIASMIPAVHDFGLFMSLIVANCWITVMLIMPPVLYIWYISFHKCEAAIARAICCCLPSCMCCKLTLPSDVAHFMDSNHGNTSQVTLPREVTVDDEDDDVPMLSMEAPLLYIDDTEDEELVHVDPDPLVIPEEHTVGKTDGRMGIKLQALLYNGLAKPIIKVRWIILGLSFVLFGVSVGLMTQLKTSTKPPQFFREDTNMQKLLDLKSKFSAIDTVECYDCSAIYSVGKQKQTQPTPEVPTSPFTEPKTEPKSTAPPIPTTAEPVSSKIPSTHHIITARPPTTTTKKHEATTAKPADHQPWKTIPPEPNYPTKPNQEPKVTAKSLPEDFDVCKNRDCSHPKERPLLESGATVYVVLGVKKFNWKATDIGHVMSDNVGQLEFDSSFASLFNFSNAGVLEGLKQLCILCKKIASNEHLVRNGSAQCLPMNSMPFTIKTLLLKSVQECRDLPKVSYIYNSQQPAHALGGLTTDGTAILWLAFAFESKTSKSKSYFKAYKEYLQWEEYLEEVKKGLDPSSPLTDLFQTSEFWPEVLMEIVAVNSAIYGVVLSMVICMVAVMLFTRHFMLLLVIFISITEMVCLVVGIFYVLGWEIGGVEAISLSILVGSSVDYCVHLVEGYILAAKACPVKDDTAKARQWRTSATFSHIGVSVISSALTTIIAALPLTQTTIQPFAKFGQIIAINTSVCILYSLTVCTALLSTIAPAFFNPSWKSTLKSVLGTAFVIGLSILAMFIMSKAGVDIPGPNGGSLFPK